LRSVSTVGLHVSLSKFYSLQCLCFWLLRYFSLSIILLWWSLPLRFPHQNPLYTCSLSHTRYMPRPSYSSRSFTRIYIYMHIRFVNGTSLLIVKGNFIFLSVHCWICHRKQILHNLYGFYMSLGRVFLKPTQGAG
jgi:hypothetical protein